MFVFHRDLHTVYVEVFNHKFFFSHSYFLKWLPRQYLQLSSKSSSRVDEGNYEKDDLGSSRDSKTQNQEKF